MGICSECDGKGFYDNLTSQTRCRSCWGSGSKGRYGIVRMDDGDLYIMEAGPQALTKINKCRKDWWPREVVDAHWQGVYDLVRLANDPQAPAPGSPRFRVLVRNGDGVPPSERVMIWDNSGKTYLTARGGPDGPEAEVELVRAANGGVCGLLKDVDVKSDTKPSEKPIINLSDLLRRIDAVENAAWGKWNDSRSDVCLERISWCIEKRLHLLETFNIVS